MTHDALVNLGITVLTGLLFTIMAAVWKCASPTAAFKESYENIKTVKKKLKGRIFTDLSLAIKPLFDLSNDRAIIVADFFAPGGDYWKEEKADTQETEQYRNALYRFIENDTNALADFRNLQLLVRRCDRWMAILRWAIILAFIVSPLSLAFVATSEKLLKIQQHDWAIGIAIIVPLLLVVAGIASITLLYHYHGQADKYRARYDD